MPIEEEEALSFSKDLVERWLVTVVRQSTTVPKTYGNVRLWVWVMDGWACIEEERFGLRLLAACAHCANLRACGREMDDVSNVPAVVCCAYD